MNIDNKSEDYIEWPPYNYTLNNPIYFVDPNGNGVNDLWSYNVDTNKLEWVSDVGGDEVQIVNVTNNDGTNYGTVAIESSEVYVFETSERVLVSGYNHQIPDGYNRNTGEEYTADDLKTRRKLIKGGHGDYVNALENSGNSGSLSAQHGYDRYVEKWGTDKAFWYGAEHYFAPDGASVADDALKALKGQGKNLSKALGKSKTSFKNLSKSQKVTQTGSGVAKARSSGTLSNSTSSSVSKATSGNASSARSASQIKNSWNKFLNQNKGKYKGKGWIKRASADYKKLQSTN
ncbi:hypothetical protein [Abyssalbus ytuae]|uniref:Uncharacterized protein n=1 Tax=Abyssalbus ytuae TaxID=2926907 RepID=A0A9E6ZL66_9FLAO|nr:hypothetical protein [Abyssalbus ytuae]UOB16280.1 hypothetical protein MQE35_11080 [Abyssalbus ytuae]